MLRMRHLKIRFLLVHLRNIWPSKNTNLLYHYLTLLIIIYDKKLNSSLTKWTGCRSDTTMISPTTKKNTRRKNSNVKEYDIPPPLKIVKNV